MQITFVADVHIGNHKLYGGEVKSGVNARCQRVIDVLSNVASKSDALFVLGDLFDTSHPTPQIITATQQAVSGSTDLHLLLGNHDMVSSADGDHALGPFSWEGAGWHVYQKPKVVRPLPDFEVLMVPFRPEPMTEWFAEAVGDLLTEQSGTSKVPRYLCFHGGVRDHNTPKFLWSAPDCIDVDLLFDIMRRGNITTALCGNWHNPRRWEREGKLVHQIGAMVPTGFDNAGWEYGTAVTVEVHANGAHVISPAKLATPVFINVTATDDGLRSFADTFEKRRRPPTYAKFKLPPGAAPEMVEEWLKAHAPGVFEALSGVGYVASTEDTEEEEREAAAAARSADSLDEALREYVSAMPLPEGVERDTVMSKVNTYMGRA
jgi:calcineurin-like phosphoesterase family protein